MPQKRYRFRCPFCDAPARRMALAEAQVNSRYGSQTFTCTSCGRLLEPDVRWPWLRLLIAGGLPVAFFVWALLFGSGNALVASLVVAPVWILLAAWLMPYFTTLRAAEQPAT